METAVKTIENDVNRNSDTLENLCRKRNKGYQNTWELDIFATLSDDDLLTFAIAKVEQRLNREATQKEQEIIKNIIIECNYVKSTSIRVVQEEFGKFYLKDFQQMDEKCPICKKINCTSEFSKNVHKKRAKL